MILKEKKSNAKKTAKMTIPSQGLCGWKQVHKWVTEQWRPTYSYLTWSQSKVFENVKNTSTMIKTEHHPKLIVCLNIKQWKYYMC